MSGNVPRIQTQSSVLSVSTPSAWLGLVPLGLSETTFRHDLDVIAGKAPFPVGFCMRSLFQRWREFNNVDVSHSMLVCRMCLGECSWALLIYNLPTSLFLPSPSARFTVHSKHKWISPLTSLRGSWGQAPDFIDVKSETISGPFSMASK